jgi:hypothetical protein
MKHPLQTPQTDPIISPTDPIISPTDPIISPTDPIILDTSEYLTLLDQSARLTMRLWERVALMPLRFSERRRLERILARLTKVATRLTKSSTS